MASDVDEGARSSTFWKCLLDDFRDVCGALGALRIQRAHQKMCLEEELRNGVGAIEEMSKLLKLCSLPRTSECKLCSESMSDRASVLSSLNDSRLLSVTERRLRSRLNEGESVMCERCAEIDLIVAQRRFIQSSATEPLAIELLRIDIDELLRQKRELHDSPAASAED